MTTVRRAPRHGFCALLSGLLVASAAAGQTPCGQRGRPWVSVSFSGTRDTADFERGVIQDFRAGLAADEIDVCAEDSGPTHAPVARVRVSASAENSVGVSVDLSDSVTAKRLGRDLDLSVVPADGRAFAVALAADELLRASWVELKLRPEALPAPPQVSHAVERVLPQVPPSSRLGARAAGERYAGGTTALGADAYFRQALGRRWEIELAAGVREGLAVEAEHGRIASTALGFRAGVAFVLIAERALSLDLELGLRAAWLRFRGEAEAGAEQAEHAGLLVVAHAGPSVSLRIFGPLRADIGAGAGLPLRGLEAEDDGRTVTGATGLAMYGQLGLSVEF